MSLPQGSCLMCESVHNPNQPHNEREHHPSNFYDLEPGKQQTLISTEHYRNSGIRLAQIDRKETVRGQSNTNNTSSNAILGTPQSGDNPQDDGRHSENTLNGHAQNGPVNEKENKPHEDEQSVTHQRSAFRNHISNFQWTWFACTMSTGGIAITLSETPHQFRGLETIGKVFFVIQLVLFMIFTCAIGLRFILEKKALYRSLIDPTESFFFGCFWLSQSTILANIQRYAVPSCGPWLIKALEILLWYYVGMTLLVAIFLYGLHFSHHDLSIEKVQPSWVLSIYPIMLAGTVASLVAPDQPTTSALPMIIGGLAFQGLGFMFSFMLITIFLWRCFNTGLPPAQMRVGMFIMVGSPGYTATALQGLAQAATKHFPPGYMGVETIPAADVLVVVSIAVAAFLWLLSFMFFSWSVVSVAFGVKKMRFDVTWWASIFPNVGWVVSTCLLGKALESQGIQWVASAMTIMLVVFWLFVAAFHLKNIFQARTP